MDAVRNRDRVLAAAKTVFSTGGSMASLDAVARAAGVGIGTLYRHFPTREALFEAVYRREVEQLVELAEALSADPAPVEALRRWLRANVEFVATKKGMAAALAMAASSELSAFTAERLPAAVGRLMARAVAAGELRDDVGPGDVLRVLIALSFGSDAQGWQSQVLRLLDVFVDGLCHPPRRPHVSEHHCGEQPMSVSTDYVPPEVWRWDQGKVGAFATNRPIAGATHEAALPVGKHPMQLYSLGTPNGQKVTILLEELLAAGHSGAEYDAWLINIGDGDQFGSGFVDINPNSKIPALVDRSGPEPIRVFESGAIMVHLAEKFAAFLPKEGPARAECLSWLFWQMGSAPFLGGGFGHFFAYAPVKIEYAIDRYAMEVKRQMDVLDRRLAESEFVAGPDYTIADMAIWPWYGAVTLGRSYPKAEVFLAAHEYKNVRRWADALDARPAVRRGRIVNRRQGEKSEQLHERHEASDFETKTEDKLAAD